jgi:hypothetical protein
MEKMDVVFCVGAPGASTGAACVALTATGSFPSAVSTMSDFDASGKNFYSFFFYPLVLCRFPKISRGVAACRLKLASMLPMRLPSLNGS